MAARIHKSITVKKLMRAADKLIGFCVGCGCRRFDVGPDARKYHCKRCKRNTVYGAEELLMYVA